MANSKRMFPVALSEVEIIVENKVFMEPSGNFRLTINGTGEVLIEPTWYSGTQPSTTAIKPEVVKDLIAGALEIGFFEMKKEYTEESVLEVTTDGTIEQGFGAMLDGEATTFSVKLGKHKKTIYAHFGYPKRLSWFYQLLLDVTGVSEKLEEWTSD